MGTTTKTTPKTPTIEACSSGNWTACRDRGTQEWGPESVVSDATREHEHLANAIPLGRKFVVLKHGWAKVVKGDIERIHADGAEHINALVY